MIQGFLPKRSRPFNKPQTAESTPVIRPQAEVGDSSGSLDGASLGSERSSQDKFAWYIIGDLFY